MTQLKVNFSGGTLKIKVRETGQLYEYLPERNRGFLDVDEADVDLLLALTYESGCRCSSGGQGERFHYFEKI